MVTIILPCKNKHKVFFMLTFTVNHRVKLIMKVRNDHKVTGWGLWYSIQTVPCVEVRERQRQRNRKTRLDLTPLAIARQAETSKVLVTSEQLKWTATVGVRDTETDQA